MTQADRLLLVDDEAVVLQTLCAVLEDEFEFDTASSVSEAMALLNEHEYAVIVTDFDLGDGTGEVLLRWAAKHMASGILLTGRPDLDEVRRLQREVEFLVLFKPADPRELITWIRHELTMGRLRRSVERTTARLEEKKKRE